MSTLTTSIKAVSNVVNFLPHLSARSPTMNPQKMGGKKVMAAIQEIVSSVMGSGAGPSGDCSSGVMGDCQPINMPKFRAGIVTETKEV